MRAFFHIEDNFECTDLFSGVVTEGAGGGGATMLITRGGMKTGLSTSKYIV